MTQVGVQKLPFLEGALQRERSLKKSEDGVEKAEVTDVSV